MKTENQTYDCVVIGGGPGGCVAATLVADAGYRVALVEKQGFPRYQIGESMIPYNYFPLERAGMIKKLEASNFPEKHSVQFVGRSGRQSQPFYFDQHIDHPCARTWQVTRDKFDQMLLDNARDHGVTVFENTRVAALLEEAGVTRGVRCVGADGQEQEFTSSFTIDASGGKGLAMSQFKWRILDKNLVKHAIWTYVRGAKRDPGRDEGATTITYLEDKNWFWYIPLCDDRVSVGVVGDKDYLFPDDRRDLEAIFHREVEKNTWIKDHLASGTEEGTFHVCVHRSYRSKYCAKDGLVLVGDALSFLDPVFSTGMYLTMVSGEHAADAVVAGLKAGVNSAKQFLEYGETMCQQIEILRRLVYAFYAPDFSFKDLIMKYPELKGSVTDVLIGNLDQDFTALHQALEEFLDLPPVITHGRAKT